MANSAVLQPLDRETVELSNSHQVLEVVQAYECQLAQLLLRSYRILAEEPVGSDGVIVEINETFFVKRKYEDGS